MRSEAEIKSIETDIAENEAFLTANPDAPTTPTRMLNAAVAAMRTNLSDLQQAHRNRFGRRFVK
jgi:hypothetical protein